jgi:hypothetical protein
VGEASALRSGGDRHSGMRQFVPGSIIVAAASVCWRGEGDVVVNFFYPVGLYGSV